MQAFARKRAVWAVVLALSAGVGCSGMSTTQQRTLSGGAIGAGVGAGVSAISGGSILTGTAVGAAAGAIGGYLYDQSDKGK